MQCPTAVSNGRILVSPTLGHQQGCVAIKTGIFSGLWDVLPCTNKTKYICKHLAEGAPLTTVAPTTMPPPCALGWTQLPSRRSCFKVGLSKIEEISVRNSQGGFCRKGMQMTKAKVETISLILLLVPNSINPVCRCQPIAIHFFFLNQRMMQ